MVTFDQNALKRQLTIDEAIKYRLYDDATGEAPILKGKLTGGIGHNFTDDGLSQDVVDLLYKEDVDECVKDLDYNLSSIVNNIDECRARVLIDLCFNEGITDLLKFVKMISALASKDYAAAAFELKNSEWYAQVGLRGPRLVNMLLLGKDQYSENAPTTNS